MDVPPTLLFSPAPSNRVILPCPLPRSASLPLQQQPQQQHASTESPQRQDTRDEMRDSSASSSNNDSRQSTLWRPHALDGSAVVASVASANSADTTVDRAAMTHAHAALESLHQPLPQPRRLSKQQHRSSPRLLASLEPIAPSASSLARHQQQQQQHSPLARAHRTTGRLQALLETQTKRIYCSDSSSCGNNGRGTAQRTRMPPPTTGQSRTTRQPQSPLASAGARTLQSSLAQIQQAQQLHEYEATRLARKLETRVDDMSGVAIPIAFLLERHHSAFAARVVLRRMCDAFARQHRRVVAAALAHWHARTVVLRVVAAYAHDMRVAKHTSLAHACAIVQRKHYARMRLLLAHWRTHTAALRLVAYTCAARVLQRMWRAVCLRTRLQTLARVYRDRVRDASATVIQSAVRRKLAQRRVAELVRAHKRACAATRIQRSYRSVQVQRIARRERERKAAIVLQRCWRGHVGRQHAHLRRQQIRCAVRHVYTTWWQPLAVQVVVVAWWEARRIQRCVRAHLTRRRLVRATQRNRQRRSYLPAWRIQRAFQRYCHAQVALALAEAVDAVVQRCARAAACIYSALQRHQRRRQNACARVVTALCRRFHAKRLVMRKQLAWLGDWRAMYLTRWLQVLSSTARDGLIWRDQLTAVAHAIAALEHDQRSAQRRLRTHAALALLQSAKRVHAAVSDGHAARVQRVWRSRRFCAFVRAQVLAARQLRTLVPQLYRQSVRRMRRRAVVAHYKRTRFALLRETFTHWHKRRQLTREAAHLNGTHATLRRVHWFRHHKLRKRMLRAWQRFVAQQRAHRRRRAVAAAVARRQRLQLVWRAWRSDALPQLTVRNRMHELALLLQTWEQLRVFCAAQRALHRADAWHCRRCKTRALAAWRLDLQTMRRDLARAQRHFERTLVRASVSALRQYLRVLTLVDQHCGRQRCRRGVRQWIDHMSRKHQQTHWREHVRLFRDAHVQRTHWQQWRRYVHSRRAHRATLAAMTAFRHRTQAQRAVRAWRDRTPVLRDVRVTRQLAQAFRCFCLTQRVFQQGFAVLWGLTVGARRVAMATRIQRAVRSKRARRQLFVLRTALKYQLETRVTKSLDVETFTPASLHAALVGSPLQAPSARARPVWVFALVSLPWQPLSRAQRTAFASVATNWRHLRQQRKRMAFGWLDATTSVEPHRFAKRSGTAPSSDASDSGDTDAAAYSVLSWLSVDPQTLPCVVAFWQGVSTPASQRCGGLPPQTLARRFVRVCSAADALVFPLGASPSVSLAMQWIEALEQRGRDATATDLQAVGRRFLARQYVQTLRLARRDAMARRLQLWYRALRCKWHTRATHRAAITLQRWRRSVLTRRRFWRAVETAMAVARAAATTLQRFVRRFALRKRLRLVCACLLATPARFAHAPLCDECFGAAVGRASSTAPGTDHHSASPSHSFALATLKCRDCAQALCTSCFASLHRSGKRMLHVADRIDAAAMNNRAVRLCDVCEVAACTRMCATCSSSTLDAKAFCTNCFERAHSDVLVATVSDDRDQHTRCLHRRAWWQSERFRVHAWSRVAPAAVAHDTVATGTYAADVVAKYKWHTLAGFEQQQRTLALAADAQKQRDDALFALRVQHEAILRDAFNRYDRDGSGSIDRHELARMFTDELCQPLRPDELDAAMRIMDTSGDGTVQFHELLHWFTATVLEQDSLGTSGVGQVSTASELLKDALRAKRTMRRYRDKLVELLPSVAPPSGGSKDAGPSTEDEAPTPTVPGFPTVACLGPRDYARKRNVFFRFVRDICGLDYVLDDAHEIPIADAMDVFTRVFVPRWNAGTLTHDFYYDDEAFEFDGSDWRRVWDAHANKYVYHTRRQRRRASATAAATGDASAPAAKRRASSRKKSNKAASAATERLDSSDAAGNAVYEDVVEPIDPRRKQQLLADATRAFAAADQDASGSIDSREFHRMLVHELCEPIARRTARAVFQAIDTDSSGTIDFDEFFLWYAADKCQDYPVTPQLARVRAVLKAQRRARAVASAAVDVGVASGLQLTRAISEQLRARQLARDTKDASPELVTLLYEGFEKALAAKALGLHNQDVDAARAWLVERREREQQEQTERAQARDAARALKKQRARAAAQQRRVRITRVKKTVQRLVFGVNKKDAHAARVQDALQNLERDILLVDEQLSSQVAGGRSAAKSARNVTR